MRKFGAILLVLLMLAAVGCGADGNTEVTETRENGGPATETAETESESETETDTESQAETKTETQAETEAATDTPAVSDTVSGNVRVILLDNDKDGVNNFKIVVDIDAARSTEKVPYTPKDDSFRTVSLYELTPEGGETLVWYTNLCMGSAPRGGVALGSRGLFVWYYDLYDQVHENGTQQLSIRAMKFGQDYRLISMAGGNIFKVPSENIEDFVGTNIHKLQTAAESINDILWDTEILLDVTGTEPIYSTDGNRITKEYVGPFTYEDFLTLYDEANQDSFIIPAE